MITTISDKWSKLALSVLGDKGGKHCHWCKFIDCDDGEAHCLYKESQFCDDDRIRTWDGLDCASKCTLFELDGWYTDDINYDTVFGNKHK